jgi:hypothetical protein
MDPVSEKRSISSDRSGKALAKDEKDVDTAAELAGAHDTPLSEEESKRIRY